MSLDELRAKLEELSRAYATERNPVKAARILGEYGRLYEEYSMRCGELGLPADR